MKKACVIFLGACLIGTFTFAAGSSSDTSFSSDSYGPSRAETDRFSEINALIKLEKYAEAHAELKKLSPQTDEADRQNLLGFTARKSGDLVAAASYYNTALTIDPKHIGALEYQGELFIQLDDIENAQRNLEKLEKICLLPCHEKYELRSALEKMLTN